MMPPPLPSRGWLFPAPALVARHFPSAPNSLICPCPPPQLLISITPRDLSFIVEENLSGIFWLFAQRNVRIDLMQNSAVAFTVCVDNDNRVKPLVMELRREYEVRWNEGLELVTVRHYDDATQAKLTAGKEILIEQRSRVTARFVLK